MRLLFKVSAAIKTFSKYSRKYSIRKNIWSSEAPHHDIIRALTWWKFASQWNVDLAYLVSTLHRLDWDWERPGTQHNIHMKAYRLTKSLQPNLKIFTWKSTFHADNLGHHHTHQQHSFYILILHTLFTPYKSHYSWS